VILALQSCEFFYDVFLDRHCFTIGTWWIMAGVLYVELFDSWTHCTLSLSSATWRAVCGHWNMTKLLNTYVSCRRNEESRAWLDNLIETIPHGDLTWVVVRMWAICYVRRKAIYDNISQSPLPMYIFVNKYTLPNYKLCRRPK